MGRSTFNVRHAAHTAKFTIYSKSRALDSDGGWSWTESSEGTRYGTIRPLRAEEQQLAQQQHGYVTHEVTMRYFDLKPTYHLGLGTKDYEVVAVMSDDERAIQTKCLVRETQTSG